MLECHIDSPTNTGSPFLEIAFDIIFSDVGAVLNDYYELNNDNSI